VLVTVTVTPGNAAPESSLMTPATFAAPPI
jgi:hypothetical protein